MKKFLTISLSLLLLMDLCACGNSNAAETTEPKLNTAAIDEDIARLEALYKDTVAYHGDLHNHSASGGRSDGNIELKLWESIFLPNIDADFAVIVDHKQTSHMRIPEWKPEYYVGGTEAATTILDDNLTQGSVVHYNMIFNDPDALEQLLEANPEYNLREDVEENPGYNTFKYAKFSSDRFRKIVAQIREKGGFFVHVHPLYDGYLRSDDPLDYWFGDYTGFEIMTGTKYSYNLSHKDNKEAYDMWVELLNLGKIVYATFGSDDHRTSDENSLSTLYATQKHSDAYLELLRAGNFTAGPVGVRMAVGDVCTGGQTEFAGKRLVVAVGDFHSIATQPRHEYRLDIYNENGLVVSQMLTGTQMQYFAIDAENCKYYRADVYDVTGDYIFAVGNPIWNTSLMEK